MSALPTSSPPFPSQAEKKRLAVGSATKTSISLSHPSFNRSGSSRFEVCDASLKRIMEDDDENEPPPPTVQETTAPVKWFFLHM